MFKGFLFFIFTTIVWPASSVAALDLSGTLFDKAGKAVGLDPLLVYAVALAESASGRGQGNISPWPWTLRAPGRPFYAQGQAEAQKKLAALQVQYGEAIDVGIMQINLHWHGHRVNDPAELLDPETNLLVGASVLATAIRSAPDDLALGIGRYHSWQEKRARDYGKRVLAIVHNLQGL
jgi:soluble lytic murein transglycosylase-like protein